jgi:hypothetical protein
MPAAPVIQNQYWIASSTEEMREYSLWHIFVLDHYGQEKYRGSRCDNEQAKDFCQDLRSGLIDRQDWRDAYYRHLTEVDIPLVHSLNEALLTDEQRTAIHEAGHAVAAIQLGINGQDYGSVTITPKDNMSGNFSMREMRSTPSELQSDLIINCSGYGALRVTGHNKNLSCTGCGDDFSKAEKLIAEFSLPSLHHWKCLATNLLSLPENTRAVKAVAECLLQHKKLGPIYTEITVMAAMGLMSVAEVEQFKENYSECGHQYWLE